MMEIKLLLAHRSKLLCEGLAKLLEPEPNIELVHLCHTGSEAVESAIKYHPDIIILGSKFPECSIIEVIDRIRQSLPKTNIILLTDSFAGVTNDLLLALKVGARAYIPSDVSFKSLLRTIETVVEGEVTICASMAACLLEEFNLLEEHDRVVKGKNLTSLTQREQGVLSLIAEEGLTNKEIASTLFISEHTVKVHLRNIMEKLHAHTRQQAVSLATSQDVLSRSVSE